MTPRPVGTEVGLTYDCTSDLTVEVGDVIRSVSTGRSYRVTVSRRVRRDNRKRSGRYHLRAVVIDPGTVDEDDVVHPLVWYGRGPGRR